MMDSRDVIIRPVISEKTYDLIDVNRYTFEVDKHATKPQIARAVHEVFDVTVMAVNTMKVHGKPKKQGYTRGHRPSWKKAVVTLKEGDRIEFFEGK